MHGLDVPALMKAVYGDVQKPAVGLLSQPEIPCWTEREATYKFDLVGVDAATESKVYPSGLLGYFKPVSDKLVWGISLYVPTGIGATWDGNELANLTGGLPFEWESFLGVATLSPVVAYKVSDTFSLGATLNFNYGMMKLKKPGVGQYTEDTSGIGFGATIGALFKPSDKFSLGLTFRTPSKVKLSGDAEMAAFLLSATSEAEREATMPLWVAAGIAVKPMDKLTITVDAHYTNWDKMDAINITYTDPIWQVAKADPFLGPAFDNDLDLKWEDKIQYRVGLEYRVSDCFALRAGYYSDPSPSPAETLNILAPQLTYDVVTFGVGFKKEKIIVDACLEYAMGKDRDVPLVGGLFPGTHGMNILVPNISVTFIL
jgi:long-chain fatty acid transport protein